LLRLIGKYSTGGIKLKKLLIIGFGLVVIGILTISFLFKDLDKVIAKDEPKVGKTPIVHKNEVKIPPQCTKTKPNKDVVGYTDFCKPIYDVNSYQVAEGCSEYNNLESFVNDIYKNWQPNSEYRSVYAKQSDADWQIAYASLHYINYFKDEIVTKGLEKQFKELQQIAYQMDIERGGNGNEDKIKELTKQFSGKLNEIYLSM
jgi:hypothetical protein